jgi:hypothetical protein
MDFGSTHPDATFFLKERPRQAQTEKADVKGLPGFDVMITIFVVFCQFSAIKLAFFSKTKVMVKFLQKLAVV